MKTSVTDTKKFRTVRGLLIGDTLLRDIVPERVELADELTAFEETTQREWDVRIYRDAQNRLTAVHVVDPASEQTFPTAR